ncbi:hypothetical protein C8Q78DRAFT_1080124 [Trametes maxima]|nr:hypothetical protein C8Q78DRAFT_1080124 [Trametes maxima]
MSAFPNHEYPAYAMPYAPMNTAPAQAWTPYRAPVPAPAPARARPRGVRVSIPATDSGPSESSTPGHGHPTTLHTSDTRPPFPAPGPDTPASTPGHGHTTTFDFARPSVSRAAEAPMMPVPVPVPASMWTSTPEPGYGSWQAPSGPAMPSRNNTGASRESSFGETGESDMGTLMHSLAGVACNAMTEEPEPFAGASFYHGGYGGYGRPAPVGGFHGGWRY